MPAGVAAGFLRHSRQPAAGGAAQVCESASRRPFVGTDGGVGTVGKVPCLIYGVNYVRLLHVHLGALMVLLMCSVCPESLFVFVLQWWWWWFSDGVLLRWLFYILPSAVM